jgi:hypothetical protein
MAFKKFGQETAADNFVQQTAVAGSQVRVHDNRTLFCFSVLRARRARRRARSITPLLTPKVARKLPSSDCACAALDLLLGSARRFILGPSEPPVRVTNVFERAKFLAPIDLGLRGTRCCFNSRVHSLTIDYRGAGHGRQMHKGLLVP